jgi:hypothetical protein
MGDAEDGCLVIGVAGRSVFELLSADRELVGMDGVGLALVATIGDPAAEMALALEKAGCGCGLRVVEELPGSFVIDEHGECLALVDPERDRVEPREPVPYARSDARPDPRTAVDWGAVSEELRGVIGGSGRVGIGEPTMALLGGALLELRLNEWLAVGGRINIARSSGIISGEAIFTSQEVHLGVGFRRPPVRPWLELGVGHLGPGSIIARTSSNFNVDVESSTYLHPSMGLSIDINDNVMIRLGGGLMFSVVLTDFPIVMMTQTFSVARLF